MSSILKRFLVLVTAAAMILSGCTAAFGEAADPENVRIEELITGFFDEWKNSDYDRMLEMCSPEWKKEQEDAKRSLFILLANRTALEMTIEQITEDGTGPERYATVVALMDRNDGKEPVKYKLFVLAAKNPDGNWYIDPESLKINEVIRNAQTETIDDVIVRGQLDVFFDGWKNSDYDRMLEACSPEWKKKQEDAKRSLVALLANRTALEMTIEQITEDGTGPERCATVLVLMDRHNGKDPALYRLSVLVTKDPDGNWYVDPESLRSCEVIAEASAKAMDDAIAQDQLAAFFDGWKNNDYDRMLEACSPEWKKKQENARHSLFALLSNRTALEMTIEQITEDGTGTERRATVLALMDRNDGKEPVMYKLSVLVTKNPDGYWYVDPESLKNLEADEETAAETENDSTTEAEAPAR